MDRPTLLAIVWPVVLGAAGVGVHVTWGMNQVWLFQGFFVLLALGGLGISYWPWANRSRAPERILAARVVAWWLLLAAVATSVVTSAVLIIPGLNLPPPGLMFMAIYMAVMVVCCVFGAVHGRILVRRRLKPSDDPDFGEDDAGNPLPAPPTGDGS